MVTFAKWSSVNFSDQWLVPVLIKVRDVWEDLPLGYFGVGGDEVEYCDQEDDEHGEEIEEYASAI